VSGSRGQKTHDLRPIPSAYTADQVTGGQFLPVQQGADCSLTDPEAGGQLPAVDEAVLVPAQHLTQVQGHGLSEPPQRVAVKARRHAVRLPGARAIIGRHE
jgi:hypothetical protein